jgi:hypothetical protein
MSVPGQLRRTHSEHISSGFPPDSDPLIGHFPIGRLEPRRDDMFAISQNRSVCHCPQSRKEQRQRIAASCRPHDPLRERLSPSLETLQLWP